MIDQKINPNDFNAYIIFNILNFGGCSFGNPLGKVDYSKAVLLGQGSLLRTTLKTYLPVLGDSLAQYFKVDSVQLMHASLVEIEITIDENNNKSHRLILESERDYSESPYYFVLTVGDKATEIPIIEFDIKSNKNMYILDDSLRVDLLPWEEVRKTVDLLNKDILFNFTAQNLLNSLI